MVNYSFVLTEDQRDNCIKSIVDRYHLDEPINSSISNRMIINHVKGNIFLADELKGSKIQADFLKTFWKIVNTNAYGPIDWESVEAFHTDGVFLSEIITDMYTIPYLYGICGLIAFRDEIPCEDKNLIEDALIRIIDIFRELSWGHGIERGSEAREIVDWLAIAGAYPLDEGDGYLPVISPIYEKLIRTSEDSSGFGDPSVDIFRAKILLNIININDIPSEDYPKNFIENAFTNDPSLEWILRREVDVSQIIAMVVKDEISFNPLKFPWHVIKVKPRAPDLANLRKQVRSLEDLTDAKKAALILKMDELGKKL